MTPAKRSRARAHKKSDYESPDECEFSNVRAGPSGSRRSSNEVIRLVQPAPIARGTTNLASLTSFLVSMTTLTVRWHSGS
jgi:hypothetical protein